MTFRIISLCLSTALALSACTSEKPAPRAPATYAMPTAAAAPRNALDRVMGMDARGLVQMFGPAQQDVREEGARKLQFGSNACILDAYLYPPSKGREPVTTYVATRTPDGRDAERNSCISALNRRN